MQSDKYKDQFAAAASEAFGTLYSDQLSTSENGSAFASEILVDLLEKPKDASQGRFALPVFRFSKTLKLKPPEIAAKISERMNQTLKDGVYGTPLLKCVAAGGFLNAQLDFETLACETIKSIIAQDSHYGDSVEGKGLKVLVEYSSPNIAKPFGVGHLRSTVIGNSLRLIFGKLGYEVIGINYLGDWGTQFGKMIVAFRKWGKDIDLGSHVVDKLYELYVRFHNEVKDDPSLDDQARQAFRRLEQGDAEATALWEKLRDLSQTDFERIYKLLGVEFDIITGESSLNDKMEPLIERLTSDGLTEVSRGALVAPVDDPLLPPCLLKKADGGTLYATRDLAGLVYRWEKFEFHRSLYVVGSAQTDYFKQILDVIRKMEEVESIDEDSRMTGRVEHIPFGWVKFGDKAMSTRQGNIIFLEEVIDKATDLITEKIRDKNPELDQLERVAQEVGVGAVIFSQLSVRRNTDVNFIWENVLSFDGESGPYLQYTHARLCSLLSKYGQEPEADINFSLLEDTEEKRLIEILADFPEAIAGSCTARDPYYITIYLLGLSGAFNTLYQRKDEKNRIVKLISDDEAATKARMSLVKCVNIVLREGLRLLGLKAPEAM